MGSRSFSGNSGGGCVEIALLPDVSVGVRDTKDRTRPAHRYPPSSWVFLTDLRAGRFAR
jgi:hypothetical protein